MECFDKHVNMPFNFQLCTVFGSLVQSNLIICDTSNKKNGADHQLGLKALVQ
jgi:hypothetical protein